jgi:hypothetical protein
VDLKQDLLGVIRALNNSDVSYALRGGMAVVLHGYPRLTKDIDLLIRPEDLSPAREVLGAIGFTLSGGLLTFDAGEPHERDVFRISKAVGSEILTVDLLLLPPFLKEVWETRETYKVEDVTIDVVDRNGLIAMKRIAGRPQDLSDIDNLEKS